MKKAEGARILLVDDEPKVLASLSYLLEGKGYRVVATTDGNRALPLIENDGTDLAIVDLVMPGLDGMTLLRTILAKKPSFPVIMLTGHGTIAKAVEATKLGAFDFLEKPVELDKIVITLENALERSRLKEEKAVLIRDALERYRMVGVSKPITEIFRLIERAAPADSRILISGESGTGKELIARAIHLRSLRAGGPFQVVNCAAIPDDLIESELFGHEKGSFTGAVQSQAGKFEMASGGTLFLDEIADMSPRVQAKVLRAIEGGEIQRVGGKDPVRVDARIIAASNKDLRQAMNEKHFREDLYFRLSVINIIVPPLRERKEDIPLLADYFLGSLCSERKRPTIRIEPAAMELLIEHPWPGNIRELRNLMEKIVVLSYPGVVSWESLHSFLQESSLHCPEPDDEAGTETLADARKAAERSRILAKLLANGWDYEITARDLDISRATLFNRLREYGIRREKV
jgi:two-component system nitrogen regulation response regulator NtrX